MPAFQDCCFPEDDAMLFRSAAGLFFFCHVTAFFLFGGAMPALAEEGRLVFDGNVVVGENAGNRIGNATAVPDAVDAVSIDLGSGDTFLVEPDNYAAVSGDGSDMIRSDAGDVKIIVGNGPEDEPATLVLGPYDPEENAGGVIHGTVSVAEGSSLHVLGGDVAIEPSAGTAGVSGAGEVWINEDAYVTSSFDMAEGSELHVEGTAVSGSLSSSGYVRVGEGGVLEAEKISLPGRLDIAGEVRTASLEAAQDSVIAVGDASSSGNLSAEHASLNGASVLLYSGSMDDPYEDDDMDEEDENSGEDGMEDEDAGPDEIAAGEEDDPAEDDEEGVEDDVTEDEEEDVDDGAVTEDEEEEEEGDASEEEEEDFYSGDGYGADISNASKAVFHGTEINGRITVGRNSLLVLGDDSADWAENAFSDTGYEWGTDVSAAVAIVKSQKLSPSGGLKVDGSLTPDNAAELGRAEANKAEFADDSLLIVSAEAASGEGALVGDGSAELVVAPEAKLHLQDAAAGKTYTVTSGFNKQDIQGWQDGNLSSNSLIDARGEVSDDGRFEVKTEAISAEEALPGSRIPKNLDELIAEGKNSVYSSSASIRFLSRAVDSQFLPEGQEKKLNEVSRGAVTAGVQNTSMKLANAAAESIEHHLSLGWHDREGVIHKDGWDAWIAPVYGNTYTSGLAIKGGAVRGNYGGVSAGADFALGTFWGGDFRMGIAINGGGGKAHVGGMVTDTHDSYNFGGFHLYSGWRTGDLNIIASAGYALGSHDVKMNLPGSMNMGQIKSEIDTHAVTAGLRAEYKFRTRFADIVPYAGVRYGAFATERHSLKIGSDKVNTVKSDTQHIVQFPVGVSLSRDIQVGSWNVKPRMDLNVTPAAGDKKAVTKVSYSGMDAWDSMRSRVMDSVTYGGMVGIQATKGKLSFGVDYGIQAGRHERDQKVRIGFSFKF